MFLKTGEIKKIMKASLKRHGLIVGYIENHYLVHSDSWGIYVQEAYASNKFKAAIMELIGDLPVNGKCVFYEMDPEEKQPISRPEYHCIDPFERWKQAKDYAVQTPLYLGAWPHEYAVFQGHGSLEYRTVDRIFVGAMSMNELEYDETMPARPCILEDVLYWKNESMIYWAHSESPGTKALTALFPKLAGLNFFEDSWIAQQEGEEGQEWQYPY